MQSLTCREDTPPASDYFSPRNFFWQVLSSFRRVFVIENVNSNVILVSEDLLREWGNRNATDSRFPEDDVDF
jgi:hypothetical protein